MKINWKKIKAKTLRALRITKPIPLTLQEKEWIKLCKYHYREKYNSKNAKTWMDMLKPLFVEIYGWDPEEFPGDFRECMFLKLLKIWLKIQRDYSGHNAQLKDIFDAAFRKSIRRYEELPIERAISEICGLIQNNIVIENGVHRYYL